MKTIQKTVGQMKIWEVLLLLGLVVFLASGASALQTQRELSEKVVRLHVLANSDTEADQALKLQVRDVLLDRTEALLAHVDDRLEAEGILRGQLLELERLAEETVRAAGSSYPVTVELAETQFPTKEYEGFALPAGEYLALRVLIGDARGQNWWCVVFPPLCAAASAEVPAAALTAGLSGEEICLITGETERYVLKFKMIELWEMIRKEVL